MRTSTYTSKRKPQQAGIVALDISDTRVHAVQISLQNNLTSLDGYGKRTHTSHLDLYKLLQKDVQHLLQNPTYGSFTPQQLVVSLPQNYYSHSLLQSSKTAFKYTVRDTLTRLNLHDKKDARAYYIPIKKAPSYDNEVLMLYSLLILHSQHISEIEILVNTLGVKSYALSTPLASLSHLLITNKKSEPTIVVLLNGSTVELLYSDNSTLTTQALQTSISSEDLLEQVNDFVTSQEATFIKSNGVVSKIYLIGNDTYGLEKFLTSTMKREIEPLNPWQNTAMYPLKPMPKARNGIYAQAIAMGLQDQYYRPL